MPAVLLQPGNYRLQFADFLDRLAAGTAHDNEWSSFVITKYYPDEFLEEMRRCTVRLGIGELGYQLDSREGRQLLRAWAIAIRSALRKDAEPAAAAEANVSNGTASTGTGNQPQGKRRLWLWFTLGFAVVFLVMALVWPMQFYDGGSVRHTWLWQYYLLEIQLALPDVRKCVGCPGCVRYAPCHRGRGWRRECGDWLGHAEEVAGSVGASEPVAASDGGRITVFSFQRLTSGRRG